jgi:hypothetical protein
MAQGLVKNVDQDRETIAIPGRSWGVSTLPASCPLHGIEFFCPKVYVRGSGVHCWWRAEAVAGRQINAVTSTLPEVNALRSHRFFIMRTVAAVPSREP